MIPSSTRAFLLRATPYRDADLVADLLTERHGRVSALARGARKSRRRFGGALDYFHLMEAQLRPGRGGLGTLQGVDLLRSWSVLSQDVDAYCVGSHVLDVVRLGAREGDPDERLFRLLEGVLEALQRGADAASLAQVFQVQVLGLLGYAPGGRDCPGCDVSLTAGAAAAASGQVLCVHCAGPTASALSAGALRSLEAADGLAIERLGALRIASAVGRELKELLVPALVQALGCRPKSLASLPGFGKIDPFPPALVT